MRNIPEKYKKLRDLCFENEEVLKKSKKCGCFYCLHQFDVSEIEEWIEDDHGLTAQCPSCGIDAVIPMIVDNEVVTVEDLRVLEKYSFNALDTKKE